MPMFLSLLVSLAVAEEPETDMLTVLPIGAAAYVGGALIHEGLGHGGACLATGGSVQGVSLANLGCTGSRQPWVVDAGGTLANLSLGAGSAVWLARRPPTDGADYTFLWLSTAVNLFQASGYLMVGPWLPVGDWGTGGVLAQAERPLPLQVGLSAAGIGMTFGTVYLMNSLGEPLFGRGADMSMRRRRHLTLVPYAMGAGLVTLSSVANRAGPEFAVSAGIANVTGTLFLAYIPLFFSSEAFIPGTPHDASPIPISRRRGWQIAGTVAAVSAVAVFGPGIGSYPQPHPLDPTQW